MTLVLYSKKSKVTISLCVQYLSCVYYSVGSFCRNQFASPRKESGIPTWQRTSTEQPVEDTQQHNAIVHNDTGHVHDAVEESSD